MVHRGIHFHPPTFNGSLATTIESKAAENIRMAPKCLFYVTQKYYTHKSVIFLHNICYRTEHQNHKIQGYQFILLLLLTAIGLSPGGSGYFTCKQNMKLVTARFKSGGLHEKHVVATWNVGNRLSVCL